LFSPSLTRIVKKFKRNLIAQFFGLRDILPGFYLFLFVVRIQFSSNGQLCY
jgi:hypothetical protein